MQSMNGNIYNDIGYNYGDFITIKNARVRKDLIIFYDAITVERESKKKHFLYVFVQGSQQYVEFESFDEAIKAVEKLDWIYKK